VSSYYDDPDFADEYRRRDEETLTLAIEEQERAPGVVMGEHRPVEWSGQARCLKCHQVWPCLAAASDPVTPEASPVPGAVPGLAGVTEQDRRDVAKWLTDEADHRVRFFPQRRDGIDTLMRHLAEALTHTAAPDPPEANDSHAWLGTNR
jgi:hypothetical protein